MASVPLPSGNDPLLDTSVPPILTPERKAASIKWLFGVAGTWLILAIMADTKSTRELASAFAFTVAASATFVLWQDVDSEVRKLVS